MLGASLCLVPFVKVSPLSKVYSRCQGFPAFSEALTAGRNKLTVNVLFILVFLPVS